MKIYEFPQTQDNGSTAQNNEKPAKPVIKSAKKEENKKPVDTAQKTK